MDYLVFGLLAGIFVGIIPVIVGAMKQQLRLGLGGFFACAVSGVIFGLLLAVPVCGIFLWQISKNEKPIVRATNYKKCPFCAEDIQFDAKVCRYCNRDLSGGTE